MIEFSVIIPVFNGAQVLPRCLKALGRQSIDRARYEIIVVDDGSTDETARLAETARPGGMPVRLLRQANAGPAAARNAGARCAQGDLLLFTDADCEPADDWIERLSDALIRGQAEGAKGVYRTRCRELVPRFVQQEYQDRYDRMERRSTIDFIDTYSAAYRRSMFTASGGFDTGYTTACVEDQEYSFRLAARGHRLILAPAAAVYHDHDRNALEYMRRKWAIGLWKIRLLRRHPGKALADSHTPGVLKWQIALLGLAIPAGILSWSGKLHASAIGLMGLLFLASMVPLLCKIARRDPAVLLVAPGLILLRSAALGFGLAAGLLRFVCRDQR